MSVQKLVVTQDETGFTMINNHVLQNLTDIEALGFWVYLASLPPNWTFYKQQLQSHFKIGRERMTRILNVLKSHALITLTNQRDAQGKFVHLHIHVCNSPSLRINAQTQKPAPALSSRDSVQPCAENPLTAIQSLDTDSYKDISKNKNNKKDISISNSATEVARKRNDDSFYEFWKTYPVKKNKVRSKKIWDKENFASIVTLICCDVMLRKQKETQWQDVRFIPHPSTYLANKLWNDEITKITHTKKSTGKSGSFDAYQAELKQQERGTIYEHSSIS
jgi:hypothetical protein